MNDDPYVINVPTVVEYDRYDGETTTALRSYRDSPVSAPETSIVRVTLCGVEIDLSPAGEAALREHIEPLHRKAVRT